MTKDEKRMMPKEEDLDVGAGTALTWSPGEERKLVRKVDLRIFPVIIILFILNFIDRNNFANARLKVRSSDFRTDSPLTSRRD